MSNYIENEIEHIDDHIEYGLLRAHNTMGGMTPTNHNTFIIEDNKFVYEDCIYTPALVKSVCEVVDNAVDEAIRCHFELGNIIKVNINNNTDIIVEDNGRGIPTKNDNKGNPMFVVALTTPQAGSNFRDDKNNAKKGTNGIGTSMAFILSKRALCETKTSDTLGILTTSNNTRNIDYKITNKKHKKTGTKITLTPDYKRYNVEEFDIVHQKVLYTYLVNQAVCYPDIKFYFDDKLINASTFKDYIKFYDDNAYLFYSDEILDIAVYPTNEYKFTYFINGLNVYDGGDALDYIVNTINNNLKSHAPKKYSKLTSSNFKNRLGYIVNYKNRTDLDWNGQTKQKCNSTFSKLNSPKIDWVNLTKNLYKDKNIIDPVLELFMIQSEFEAKKELKNLDKKQTKIIRNDKFLKPIGEWSNIFLAEGDSASASISKILGRNGNGFYAMFGVPPNSYDIDLKDIVKSKKLIDLKDILNISFTKTTQNEVNFKNIIIATDFDLPGHFITGQLLGLFFRFARNLFYEKRIKRFVTPLVVVKDKNDKIITWFYNFTEYFTFQKENLDKKYKYDYKKGLGSWDKDELDYIISIDKLDNMLEVFVLDDNSELMLDNWLSSSKSDERKAMLEGFSFNIMEL